MVKPKNLLENPWTLWYELKPEAEQSKSGYYGERLQEVCSMESVEDFHQYYSYMKAPESLPNHATLYIFRDSAKPMWETFPSGGAWTFRLKRGDARINGAWERLALSCVGEGLGSSNVAGIVLGSRTKEFVLSVWLSSGQSSELRFEIMNRLRELFELTEGDVLQYKEFSASIKDDNSRVNAVTYRVKGKSSRPNKRYILPDPVGGSFTFNYTN